MSWSYINYFSYLKSDILRSLIKSGLDLDKLKSRFYYKIQILDLDLKEQNPNLPLQIQLPKSPKNNSYLEQLHTT